MKSVETAEEYLPVSKTKEQATGMWHDTYYHQYQVWHVTYYHQYQDWNFAKNMCSVRQCLCNHDVDACRRWAHADAVGPIVYAVSRPPPDADVDSGKRRQLSPAAKHAF